MESPQIETHADPTLVHLLVSFLRLGTTAFGGPAMVAYIHKLAVEKNHWLDETTFQDGVALCQAIPGATAMQTAAYVGLRSRGLAGAAVAFVSFGLPAFCFMAFLSAIYTRTHDLPLVVAAFQGLRAVTVAIVANATLSFGKRSLTGWGNAVIAALATALLALKASPILVVFLAAALGLVLVRKQGPPKPQVVQKRVFRGRPRSYLTPLLVAVIAGYALLFVANRGLFDLGLLMFKIDMFAFGGGFASLPLMHHEIVGVRSWLDGETFMSGIALGQITPGPIVITATFVGYLLHGIAGAIVATVSVFLPSFLMLVGTVPYFDRLRSAPSFHRCLSGILASFVGLLLSVTIQFALGVSWDTPRIVLASAALVALLLRVDVLWVVLVGIVLSLVIM